MTRRAFVRFGIALPAIWLILTMVFLLVHIVPGDPVQQMLGEDARPEDLNNLRHVLGLDQPLHTQYRALPDGAGRAAIGARSFHFGSPVLTLVLQRYPATLELAFTAMIVCARNRHSRRALPRRGVADAHPITRLASLLCWDYPCPTSRLAPC